VFALQSIAAQPERPERAGHHGAAEASGFSLHAGLDIQPGERAELERLRRYVSRSPADLMARLAGLVPPPRTG
jgi:hypothetical protein